MSRVALVGVQAGLERVMERKRTGGRVPEPPALPPDQPCYGGKYGMGRRCIGVCYKQLLKGRRKHD